MFSGVKIMSMQNKLGTPMTRIFYRSHPSELWALTVAKNAQAHFVDILMARVYSNIPRRELLRAIGNKDV